MKSLGNFVVQCREKAGFSQAELAHRAEIHVTYISKIERGVYTPPITTLQRIAKELSTPLPEFTSRAIAAKGYDLSAKDFGIKTKEGHVTKDEMKMVLAFREQPRSVQQFILNALR